MTTVEVLKAARARIEKGWIQGDFVGVDTSDNEVAWCVYGAIGMRWDDDGDSVGGDPDAEEYLKIVLGIDSMSTEENARSLDQWNDAPGRTQAQVLEAFDAALALAEAATSRDAAGMK